MVYERGYVTDEALNFYGRAWASPDGRYVLASGSIAGGLSARLQILYKDKVSCWRSEANANCNEGAVNDCGLCLLSFSWESKEGSI